MKTILDTGPLVAFLNRADTYHEWARAVFADVRLPFWTCEPVLTEAAHLTRSPAVIVGMLADGLLRIGLELEEQVEGINLLLRRYAPRMDLADACVVRMSEISRGARVLTIDRRDFQVYRRNGREVIPLLSPDN